MGLNPEIEGLDPGSLAEWAGVIATLAIALVSGIFALWQFHRSRRTKREAATTRQATDATTGSHSQRSFSDEPSGMKSDAAYTHVKIERPRVEITWVSKSSFVLRNLQVAPLRVECVRNRDEFVHLDLPDAFTLEAGRALQGHAFGAWQLPLPADLVLDIVGEDAPLVIPIPLRPGT